MEVIAWIVERPTTRYLQVSKDGGEYRVQDGRYGERATTLEEALRLLEETLETDPLRLYRGKLP